MVYRLIEAEIIPDGMEIHAAFLPVSLFAMLIAP